MCCGGKWLNPNVGSKSGYGSRVTNLLSQALRACCMDALVLSEWHGTHAYVHGWWVWGYRTQADAYIALASRYISWNDAP